MTDITSQREGGHANVCLLLEGTFPYVRGGVSSWIRQLIEGMPQLSFSIIYLGSDSQSHGEPVYELPANVIHLETHFLLDPAQNEPAPPLVRRLKKMLPRRLHQLTRRSGLRMRGSNKRFETSRQLHEKISHRGTALDVSVSKGFAQLMLGDDAISEHELQTHDSAWQSIREQYANAPEGLDFNHYFWSVRSMHAPLFKMSAIAAQAPHADIYHAVSTGYAGFLGTLISEQRSAPFLISEHGIYTKERELDLAQVDWIPEDHDPFKVGLNDDMGYLRGLWIRFFESLGRMAYASASEVFTLYEGNRQRQITDGANPETLTIIPNGVDIERYAAVRRAVDSPVPPVIALVGRIVPIKDIKTFIRSMQIVRETLPDVQGWLYGPEDEDKAYTRECRDLVSSLDLHGVVKFKGYDKPENIFAQVGLTVLSSVSEGQPLVVLEGFAAGIPAVTTAVGSCAELIHGVDAGDWALGSAGSVVPIANPDALARAVIALMSCSQTWQSASHAAIERVEQYYSDKEMIARYAQVYERHGAIASGSDNQNTGAPAHPMDRAA